MFTDEDYLDELLKSIEPITKQNEEEPEPEAVIEEQVVATSDAPIEESIAEMPVEAEIPQPESVFEMPTQPEPEASVFELGSGDMGMSEAEIDALINAARNTPLITGGSSPNYVETQSVDYSQEIEEDSEQSNLINDMLKFDGQPEIIQAGDVNNMDIPMDLFADPDSFETIATPVSADNVSGQDLMDLGLFSDESEFVTIATPTETTTDIMPDMDDGEDIAALLGQFSDNSDISDIMNILEKDEKNEAVDESMFDAYDEAEKLFEESDSADGDVSSEEVAEGETEKEKKKLRKKKEKPVKEKVKKEKVKKEKRVKPSKEENSEDTIKEKTPGFFSKLVTIMTQEEEEGLDVPEILETGITDENADILRDLSKEDNKKKIKGDKKSKKEKKGKKDKKDKKPVKEESEDDIREKSDKDDDASDDKKGKKKNKKEKKEKKPKKLKVMELSAPEKKIPRRYIIATVAFCLTIMFAIIIISSVYTGLTNLKTARWAFDNGDYQTSYEHLYGEKLSEKDQLIFDKSAVILTIERKLDSYENFKKLGMETEALNALFEGVSAYKRISVKAEELNVISKVDKIYNEILNKFAEYGLSEEEVEEILAYESDAAYTKKLESIVTGVPFEELYE